MVSILGYQKNHGESEGFSYRASSTPDLSVRRADASLETSKDLRRKSETTTIPADSLEAAVQIIDFAETRGVRLRLLGGLAFKALCPSTKDPRYARENKDIDLIGKREDTRGVMKTLETLGYKPREVFNKLNMGQRLIYYDMVNKRRVDVFLDEFIMCHKFNFKENILKDTHTLPLTQLVMTKLQVVEKTEKEYKDLVAAFRDFDVTNGKGGIHGNEIADLCCGDWGVYTTFRKSLKELEQHANRLDDERKPEILERVQRLVSMMETKPKTFSWKMRAKIGEKAKWYDLPESDSDAVFSQ